ncbi:MAG: YlqD family protein [Armatimonadota bacterium]
MPRLVIKRPVLLKAIVTERLKEELKAELDEEIGDLDEEIQALDNMGNRYYSDLARTNLQQAMALRQQVENEKRRRERAKQSILQRQNEIAALELGSEFPRGTIEADAVIEPGDNLNEVLNGVEIIVKDDVIQEIRGVKDGH